MKKRSERKKLYDKIHEIWRDIDGWGGAYQVSSLGNVRSKDHHIKFTRDGMAVSRMLRGHPLKPHYNKKRGYYYVGIQRENKRKNIPLHRLVCISFHPNPHNKPAVNHKDGDKKNNKADNLEWVTYKENNDHAIKTGLSQVVKTSKLSPLDVMEIRNRFAYGSSLNEITEDFPVSKATICRVVNNKIWRDIA